MGVEHPHVPMPVHVEPSPVHGARAGAGAGAGACAGALVVGCGWSFETPSRKRQKMTTLHVYFLIYCHLLVFEYMNVVIFKDLSASKDLQILF